METKKKIITEVKLDKYLKTQKKFNLLKGNTYYRFDKDNWFIMDDVEGIIKVDEDTRETLEKNYAEIVGDFSININFDDLYEYSSPTFKDYFSHLTKKEQQEFIIENESSIKKGLEWGLMFDSDTVYRTIMNDLELPKKIFKTLSNTTDDSEPIILELGYEDDKFYVEYLYNINKGSYFTSENYKTAENKFNEWAKEYGFK